MSLPLLNRVADGRATSAITPWSGLRVDTSKGALEAAALSFQHDRGGVNDVHVISDSVERVGIEKVHESEPEARAA